MRDLFVVSVLFILKANGQCNIPSPFASSTWLDSTRGTITFDTTTMNGWGVTVFNQQRSSWECVDSSDSSTLVLKSTTSILYSNSPIFIFMCMKLTQITTNSYSYKLQQGM
ncbi:uncharacterized protein LOC132731232 [Ruditapes philippinarum]|uniref:uncharacterized protein LOC132731232 n=1 Tax=Ruditapes philippinarum TaxID=129788 RepID=UPI00295BA60E|nr:uncharacterized protein LOC132731232 [Ruditapes philippinarum]